MELRVLRYFLAVAREESISGAAEALHVTQPTLSRQMMELEEELGKTLFLRGKRKISLTEEGMFLRKRAQEIVTLVEKTESEFSAAEETISGDVHIGGGETDAMRLIARAAQQNVGFIAMKPMAGGNLTDGTLALRYILQNPGVTLAIPGMAEVPEVEENARAAEALSPLTQAEQEKIAVIRKELSGNFCRRCGYCAPCTVGIDIPSCFLFEGYLKRYDLAQWAKERYSGMKVKASACIGCGKCEARCPYELPIREKLKAVAAAFEA